MNKSEMLQELDTIILRAITQYIKSANIKSYKLNARVMKDGSIKLNKDIITFNENENKEVE